MDARTDLIHHFLPRRLPWAFAACPASEDSTRTALDYLDLQRAQALAMPDRLQGLVNSLQ